MKPWKLSLIALIPELLGGWKIAFGSYEYLEEENLTNSSEILLVGIVQKWNLKDKIFLRDRAENHNLEIKNIYSKIRKRGL